MILDSLNEGDTLRLILKPENGDRSRIVCEGFIIKNSNNVLILRDKDMDSVLSCRVLKSKVDINHVPVEALVKYDHEKEVLTCEMARFKADIDTV